MKGIISYKTDIRSVKYTCETQIFVSFWNYNNYSYYRNTAFHCKTKHVYFTCAEMMKFSFTRNFMFLRNFVLGWLRMHFVCLFLSVSWKVARFKQATLIKLKESRNLVWGWVNGSIFYCALQNVTFSHKELYFYP